jgi:tetratricopeptide (TPR) repeat protein
MGPMKSSMLISRLLLGCILFSGCQAMGDKDRRDLISPLSSDTGDQRPQRSLSQRYNERKLCIETAETVAANGHAREAIKLYEKAEGLEPDGEPLDLRLAPLYAQIGNCGPAIERYRRAIKSGKATAEVYNNLAWTLIESGQPNDAIAAVQDGLSAAPENERLRATHAVALYKLGDRAKSLELFRELYGPAAAHHNLAVLDVDSGQLESAAEHARLAAGFPDCPTESIQLHETIQSNLATTPATRPASWDAR